MISLSDNYKNYHGFFVGYVTFLSLMGGVLIGGEIADRIEGNAKKRLPNNSLPAPQVEVRMAPRTQNIVGDKRPEKFYAIRGPDGKDITAFLEIDGRPVWEYFVNKPYVGPVEKKD